MPQKGKKGSHGMHKSTELLMTENPSNQQGQRQSKYLSIEFWL